MSSRRFRVVPNHIYGPSIIDRAYGSLVDSCPSVESATRIRDALAEAISGDPKWALPEYDKLEPIERQRVHRYMMKLLRQNKSNVTTAVADPMISVEPFRKAFATSGLTRMQLSKLSGIEYAHLSRVLGFNLAIGREGKKHDQKAVTYELAEKLGRALNMDPVDWEDELAQSQTYSSGMRAEVDLTPIREAFQRSPLTVTEVAKAADMDPKYVSRLLGLSKSYKSYTTAAGQRKRSYYQVLSTKYENGVKLVRALGYDPVDFGL